MTRVHHKWGAVAWIGAAATERRAAQTQSACVSVTSRGDAVCQVIVRFYHISSWATRYQNLAVIINNKSQKKKKNECLVFPDCELWKHTHRDSIVRQTATTRPKNKQRLTVSVVVTQLLHSCYSQRGTQLMSHVSVFSVSRDSCDDRRSRWAGGL